MRTIVVLSLFMGLAILPCNAQLNRYKYFVVPKRFDIFKETNQYQTSTLVKFLLTKSGYEAIYDDAIPEDLFWNKCRGVTVQLDEKSSFLQTKLSVVFLDCNGREVFRTAEGTSKSKEYREAYSECIQEAMDVMTIMKYEYEGSDDAQEPLPKTPTEPLLEPVEAIPSVTEELIISSEVAEVVSAPESEAAKVQTETVKEPIVWSEAINENGYILSHLEDDSTWVLMRTSNEAVYLAYSQNKQGIAFKQPMGWKLEYYLGDERQDIMIRTRDQ